MTIDYNILELFNPFLLGYCNCGCGKNVTIYYNKIRKYINGHSSKGKNNPNWQGGRWKNKFNYWYLYLPDYFSCYKDGTVREHIYFYQEKNKCCLLPWGIVHHIDFNKENNMPWNLEGMMRSRHMSIHFKKDTSNYECSKCKSKETYIDKNGYKDWRYDELGFMLCNKCDMKDYHKKRKINYNLCRSRMNVLTDFL